MWHHSARSREGPSSEAPSINMPTVPLCPGLSLIHILKEESGLARVRPVSEDIYSLEVLTVDGHEKRGAYVGSHLHLNVTYLLEADENDAPVSYTHLDVYKRQGECSGMALSYPYR